jgi:hypothetical protein
MVLKARVRAEHCIGLLKNRFQSLRNIRTVIYCLNDMLCIIEQVWVCTVLHNMLIGSTFPQEWIEPNAEDLNDNVNVDNDDDDDQDDDIVNNINNRREAIMSYMLN